MLRGPTPVPATSVVSSPERSRTTISSVKSGEVASRSVEQLDPPLLRQVGRVHQVDRLLGVAAKDPREHRDPEDPGVLVGEAAEELDLDPVGGAVAERLGEGAELLAEGHEGRQPLHRLGAHRGDVDRGGDDAAGEGGGDLLGRDHPRAVLGLGGRGAEVGSDDDVVALEDRMAAEGLFREDVQGGPGDLALIQPVREGVEVDELAPGAVDDPHPVSHLRRLPRRR